MASVTIYDVAALAGVSIKTVSRVSRGLEIDIGVLFSSGPAAPLSLVTGRRSINRAGEGRLIETATYESAYVATDLLNKRFVPIVTEIRARSMSEFGEWIRHPGEEYTYVLEGTVELHTEMYAPVVLRTGDSIYFDSGMGHAYLLAGSGPCRLLTICSGDEPQLIAAARKDQAADSNAEAGAVSPKRARRAVRRRAGGS